MTEEREASSANGSEEIATTSDKDIALIERELRQRARRPSYIKFASTESLVAAGTFLRRREATAEPTPRFGTPRAWWLAKEQRVSWQNKFYRVLYVDEALEVFAMREEYKPASVADRICAYSTTRFMLPVDADGVAICPPDSTEASPS